MFFYCLQATNTTVTVITSDLKLFTPGTDAMILKMFSTKKSSILIQIADVYAAKIIITLAPSGTSQLICSVVETAGRASLVRLRVQKGTGNSNIPRANRK
jgi:hypothetical protein